MSAFEDFVQTELPKRGYLTNDVATETLIIRRGAGPRQFDALTLTEGQVVALVNGQLAGVNVAAVGGGVRKAVVTVAEAQTTWSINHNLRSENVIVQCFDETKSVMIPSTIQIVDQDNITITFGSAQAGVARVIFLD